jgi:hypothetical protein
MIEISVMQAIAAAAMAISSAPPNALSDAASNSGQSVVELRNNDRASDWTMKVQQDPPTSTTQDPTQNPSPTATPAPQNPGFFNPQLSLVTDFRAILGGNVPNSQKTADMKEAELGFAADVDPFLRAEAYISVAKEGGESKIDVEEAFGLYSNLGRGLSGKFGKIAAAIGRVQRNHADQLNWLDYPLVIQDFLGDEGFRAGGASFSYLMRGDRFNEFTLEGLDGRDTKLFAGSKSTTPTYVGRYRTFFDFNENTSMQLGASVANGPSANIGKRATMYGLDSALKWSPGTQGKSAQVEAEAYWADSGIPGADTAFGAFAAITYELKPRLFLTAKYDYSELPGTPDIHQGFSIGATLKVTEFHHWRLEYKNISSNFDKTRNVLALQFQWAIGAHPAHKY